jgi:hypothetical protein
MLQSGYKNSGFHHIFAVPSRLARTKSCASESPWPTLSHVLRRSKDCFALGSLLLALPLSRAHRRPIFQVNKEETDQ